MARLLYINVAFVFLSAFLISQLQGDGKSYPLQHVLTKFLIPLLRQFSAIVRDRAHSDDFAPHSDNFAPVI